MHPLPPPPRRRFSFLRSDGGGGFFGDEFVYDRFERRFVSADNEGAVRRGHSDLRLDRCANDNDKGAGAGAGAAAGAPYYDERYYYYRNPRFSHEEAAWHQHQQQQQQRQHQHQQQHQHVRELVRSRHQLEPQRFKTIIFLSGH